MAGDGHDADGLDEGRGHQKRGREDKWAGGYEEIQAWGLGRVAKTKAAVRSEVKARKYRP
jgi:hypothetical protein